MFRRCRLCDLPLWMHPIKSSLSSLSCAWGRSIAQRSREAVQIASLIISRLGMCSSRGIYDQLTVSSTGKSGMSVWQPSSTAEGIHHPDKSAIKRVIKEGPTVEVMPGYHLPIHLLLSNREQIAHQLPIGKRHNVHVTLITSLRQEKSGHGYYPNTDKISSLNTESRRFGLLEKTW